jgi:hypothetical protein
MLMSGTARDRTAFSRTHSSTGLGSTKFEEPSETEGVKKASTLFPVRNCKKARQDWAFRCACAAPRTRAPVQIIDSTG